METRVFYRKTTQEVLDELDSSKKGLSEQEAAKRLEKYGPNEIEEKKQIHPIKIFLSQFKSPIVWVLIVAMTITLVVHEYTDFFVIGAIVLLNALLGFIQEYKAEKAIKKLKDIVSLEATVFRDGEKKQVEARNLVPGDIIFVSTGSKIPADGRVVESSSLKTQEAALTGESTSVSKESDPADQELQVSDRTNMIFSGTVVTKGKAKAVVTQTGMDTEIGQIASMIQEGKDSLTPLQEKMKQVATKIGILSVIAGVIIFVAGITLHQQGITELLLTAIALAVAVIPEGLPAVITLSLSLGVQRMADKNALVRKLPSVETLGSASVVCSDKTGTLTHNQMTVKKIYANDQLIEVSGSGYKPEGGFEQDPEEFKQLLLAGALNNNAKITKKEEDYEVQGDPTEAALLVSAKKAGLDYEKMQQTYPRKREIEFSSERKRMSTINETEQGTFLYMKGSIEEVLDRSDRILINGKVREITDQDKEKIKQANDEMASNALRVLGFGYRKVENTQANPDELESNMVFLGLQGMIDPPRAEAKEAIEECKTAGIDVKMITGDHKKTAAAIAAELGIEGDSIEGEELEDMSKEQLQEEIDQIGVFARVSPEHKMKLVEALRDNGEIVAMTGDGVNDAPALKHADLGIAMGITGTDVTKESGDMILADDNFATIEQAIEEGRRIYDNIKKFLAYLLSGNIAEVLVVLLSILFGWPLPITAIQILWINLMTDSLPALALGSEPAEPGVMQREPRDNSESIFQGLSPYLLVYPLAATAAAMYVYSTNFELNLVKAQTLVFTMLVFFELFESLACRSTNKSFFEMNFFSNKWLILAVTVAAALQISIIHIPFLQNIFSVTALSLLEWSMVIAGSICGFFVLEAGKAVQRRFG